MLTYLLKLLFIAGLQTQQLVINGGQQAIVQSFQSPGGPKKVDTEVIDVVISAHSAIAVDAESGQVLYQKDSDHEMPIASITKLMTALVFLETKTNLDDLVLLNESDRHLGGLLHFNIGEKIKKRDLFYAMLIASDNEAAYLLARSAGLSVPEFVAKMNARAKSLGMTKTNFVDPTGLDRDNVASASDLVKLLIEVSNNSLISEVTKKKGYAFEVQGVDDKPREVKVYTTDALASSSYLKLLTGKTGYLQEAGYCLATKLKSQINREIYVVVLKSDTVTERFQDVKAIEYYISKNYQ